MSRRARALLLVSVAITFSTGTTTTADAQPTPMTSAPKASPRRTVAITIAGPADEARVLEDTIRELLARLQLTMVGRNASPARTTMLVTVDVDLAAQGGARVTVTSATGSTVLHRTIAADAGVPIQREQIAHAVRGAAEAELLIDEDRVAGRAPPVAPEPPEPPTQAFAPPAATAAAASPTTPLPIATSVPTPSTSTDARDASPSTRRGGAAMAVDLATFAGVGIVAKDAEPVARVGGSAAIASRRGLRPSLAIGVLYAFPFEVGSPQLSARSSLALLRAMPAIEILRGSRFAIDAGVGGGIDILSVHPTSTTLPSSAIGRVSRRVSPILSAGLTGRLALASDVALTLGALVDLDVAARRYVFDDRGQQSDVLVPLTVRPTILAGLSFTAFGEARFAPGSRR